MTDAAQNPPVTDAVAALFDTIAGDKKKMAARAKPGDYVIGKGFYIGPWQRKDGDGNSLGSIFNVFAAPQDLQNEAGKRTLLTYNDTLEYLSHLKGLECRDGKAYADDKALFQALEDGSYDGEWVIPPLDVLDFIGSQTFKRSVPWKLGITFYMGTDSFFFNSFTEEFPSFYWSSTFERQSPSYVHTARTGLSGILAGLTFRPDNRRCSCRPVRFEPVEVSP